jgi:hypothetical protein
MSLDPPKVLLDRSFMVAVADPEHPEHERCALAYAGLVERYERHELLLVAVGTHLRDLDLGTQTGTLDRFAWFLHRPHRGVLAPVDPLYVGFQHRRAASGTPVDDPDLAITLVMCDRHRVRRVATLSDRPAEFGLEVVAPLAEPDADDVGASDDNGTTNDNDTTKSDESQR